MYSFKSIVALWFQALLLKTPEDEEHVVFKVLNKENVALVGCETTALSELGQVVVPVNW